MARAKAPGIKTLDPVGRQCEVSGEGLSKVISDIPDEPANKGIAFAVGVSGTSHPISGEESLFRCC